MPLTAMYNVLFRAVQVGAAGYCINDGIQKAIERYESKQKGILLIHGWAEERQRKVPLIVEKWVRAELEKHDVCDASSIPLIKSFDNDGWAAAADTALFVPDRDDLEFSLHFVQRGIQSYRNEEVIDVNTQALKHEIGHLKNKDCERRIYAQALMPLCVQGVCSTASGCWNKIWNIKSPKTFKTFLLRSCGAAGSIVPKLLLSGLGMVGFKRYQEQMADIFACEKAESRSELEARRKDFQEHTSNFTQFLKHPDFSEVAPTMKNLFFFACMSGYIRLYKLDELDAITLQSSKHEDRMFRMMQTVLDEDHPYPADRAAMAQEYLDKWDEEQRS